MRAAWKAWGPAAVWAGVLFLLSEVSTPPSGPDFPAFDKVVHFLLYGVLGVALARGQKVVGSSAPAWAVMAVGWLYGAMDELHQTLVPGRSADPWDFAVDVLGVTAGFLGFVVVARVSERSCEPKGPRSTKEDEWNA